VKRARISKKGAAEALISLGEVSEPVDTDTAEPLLSSSEMELLSSQLPKEKDAVVQTTITLENIKAYPTECLISTTKMKKGIFMKNVANDTVHYTGDLII